MVKKFTFVLSLLYFILLCYNLFVAQFIVAGISFILFLITCPYFFRKIKESNPVISKIATSIGRVSVVLMIATIFIGILNGNGDEIPPEEQVYIDTVLTQITSETTKEEVLELLGKPSRDLVLKVNWWVSFDNRNSRVGVYFSATTGKAEEVVLDGGWGSFYYRKKLIE